MYSIRFSIILVTFSESLFPAGNKQATRANNKVPRRLVSMEKGIAVRRTDNSRSNLYCQGGLIPFRPDFYYETAADFCFHLGFNPDQVAEYTGASIGTARRWIKTNRPPPWLLPFLYCCAGGVVCADFYGFRLIDGILTAPTLKGSLTAAQVALYSWHIGALALYQAENEKRTRAQNGRSLAAVLKFPDIGS